MPVMCWHNTLTLSKKRDFEKENKIKRNEGYCEGKSSGNCIKGGRNVSERI